MVRVGLVVALVAVGAVAGAVLNLAPLYLAIPVGLVLLVPLLRALRRDESPEGEGVERNRLGAPRLPFTERDRDTLAP